MPEPDLELIRRARQGDANAFHLLVDRYAQPMFALAYSLLKNAADAEDVVQETFAGAFKSLGRFEERSSVKTWLSRILVIRVARLRRDRGPLQMTSLETIDVPVESKNASVDAKQDLRSTLEKLTVEHRDVLVLREIQRLSYDEIAKVLGVPRGTVESRLHRARADLRAKLKEYES